MDPIVVFAHVTGPSGSGKTHIGSRLQSLYNVKDIDDFLQAEMLTSSSAANIQASERVFARIVQHIREWVVRASASSALPIVLVGLSHLYATNTGAMLHIPIQATWRISIDVNMRSLIRQFVMRDLQIMCSDREQALADIIEGKYTGRWTADSIRAAKDETDRIYRNRGYVSMSGARVVEFLVECRKKLQYMSFDYYSDLYP